MTLSKQIDAFNAFLKECKETYSDEVAEVLEYLGEVIEAKNADSPLQSIQVLSDSYVAKMFVIHDAAHALDLWDEDNIEAVAEEFASLIDRFLEFTSQTELAEAWGVRSGSTEFEIAAELLCGHFAERLDFVDPCTQFNLADLAMFVTNGRYLREKTDAILEKDAPRLLQLMFQDKTQKPHSTSLAESELMHCLDNFHDNCPEAVARYKNAARESTSPDSGSDRNTIKLFKSSLKFTLPQQSPKLALLEAFLEDDERGSSTATAAAIQSNDAAELTRLCLAYQRRAKGHLPGASEQALRATIRALLDDFHSFIDLDDNRTPSTFGAPSVDASLSAYAEVDLKRFRCGHPELQDAQPPVYQNLDFYRGAIPHPRYQCFIDDFHEVDHYRGSSASTTTTSQWFGQFSRLECEHDFIQHLFPLQEGKGLSSHSQRLQKHEIVAMQADGVVAERVLRSAETMFHFYGIDLNRQDVLNPELSRSAEFLPRFQNLNASLHNYLRITRICKFLAEMRFEKLQEALVDFFIRECFEWSAWDLGAECLLPNLRAPCSTYWVGTIKDDDLRSEFLRRIEAFHKCDTRGSGAEHGAVPS